MTDRLVIEVRRDGLDAKSVRIGHRAKGRFDFEATWQPIHCWGGIAFPFRSTDYDSRCTERCFGGSNE